MSDANANDTLNAMSCDNDNMHFSNNKSLFDLTDNATDTPLASQIQASSVVQPQPNSTLAMLTAPIVN
jgi:hypothetical protein